MKTKAKKRILKMFAKHLKYFKPNLQNHFVCPTCLAEIPISDIGNISVAHIVPKSAGGKLTTFVCKQCNDIFGRKQDLWFGDALNVINSPYPNAISTKIRKGHFEVCGVKVNGDWKMADNGGLVFDINYTKNDPSIVRPEVIGGEKGYTGKLMEALNEEGNQKNLQIPLPILGKENYINTGFLTAAYLLWFRAFGYSWVFQNNLDIVRKQIANPDDKIISFGYCIKTKKLNMNLWYGLIPMGDAAVPAMGLSHAFVLLPQRNIPKFYENITKHANSFMPKDIISFNIIKEPTYGPPTGVLFEENAIILPELQSEALKSAVFLVYHRNSDKPIVMHQISKTEHEKLLKQDDVVELKTKFDMD